MSIPSWPRLTSCALAALGLTGPLYPGAACAALTKAACVDANTAAQSLRRDGKLGAAAEQLRTCQNVDCPAIVRDDCTKRLDELVTAQPTVVFEVIDGTGARLSAVTVTMDGSPVANRLDGTALPVDIGEHRFVLSPAGHPAVTRTVFLVEGEKARRERIVLGPTLPQPPVGETRAVPPISPPPPRVAPPPPRAEDRGNLKTAGSNTPSEAGSLRGTGVVLGLAGLAGIGVGTAFGVMTMSKLATQKSDCGTTATCTQYDAAASAHTQGMTFGAVSTAAFGVGGALFVTGAVLFFLPPRSKEERATAAALSFAPAFGAGSIGAIARGEF